MVVKGGQKLAGPAGVRPTCIRLRSSVPRAAALPRPSTDLNDKTRAFSKRFAEKFKGRMPTSVQAGFYSATLAYLNAVKATGTDDPDKVMAQMKATTWDDPVFGKSSIRADGRKMHDMYLFEVKTPAESKGPWDY